MTPGALRDMIDPGLVDRLETAWGTVRASV